MFGPTLGLRLLAVIVMVGVAGCERGFEACRRALKWWILRRGAGTERSECAPQNDNCSEVPWIEAPICGLQQAVSAIRVYKWARPAILILYDLQDTFYCLQEHKTLRTAPHRRRIVRADITRPRQHRPHPTRNRLAVADEVGAEMAPVAPPGMP